MADGRRASKSRGPGGRVSRWFERLALGAIMSVVAFVVERRLLKMIRKRGESAPLTGGAVELSAAPAEQVDEQARR